MHALLTSSHLKFVVLSMNTYTFSTMESVGKDAASEQSLTVTSRADAKMKEHPAATRATTVAKVWKRDA